MLKIINTLKYIFLTLLFCLCISIGSMLYASASNDAMLSVEFDNLSLSDALSKLKDASGVDIVLKRSIDNNRLINKKYDNFSLDDIILDIFSDDNLTASFRYSDDRLTAVSIWLLPRIKGGYNKPVLFYEGRERRKPLNELGEDTAIKDGSIKDDTVNDTGAGDYFVNLSGKDATQYENINNYAANQAIINAINNGTTGIPAAPVPNETPGLETPPMPPGM